MSPITRGSLTDRTALSTPLPESLAVTPKSKGEAVSKPGSVVTVGNPGGQGVNVGGVISKTEK